jgi:hypothetical protein
MSSRDSASQERAENRRKIKIYHIGTLPNFISPKYYLAYSNFIYSSFTNIHVAYKTFHLPSLSHRIIRSILFHQQFVEGTVPLHFISGEVILHFILNLLYIEKMVSLYFMQVKQNFYISSTCSKAVTLKVYVYIIYLLGWLMFHIRARTLKYEGKLKHKFIFCAFTFQ